MLKTGCRSSSQQLWQAAFDGHVSPELALSATHRRLSLYRKAMVVFHSLVFKACLSQGIQVAASKKPRPFWSLAMDSGSSDGNWHSQGRSL